MMLTPSSTSNMAINTSYVSPLRKFPCRFMKSLGMIRSLRENFPFAPDYRAPAEKASEWMYNFSGNADLAATKL